MWLKKKKKKGKNQNQKPLEVQDLKGQVKELRTGLEVQGKLFRKK